MVATHLGALLGAWLYMLSVGAHTAGDDEESGNQYNLEDPGMRATHTHTRTLIHLGAWLEAWDLAMRRDAGNQCTINAPPHTHTQLGWSSRSRSDPLVMIEGRGGEVATTTQAEVFTAPSTLILG